MKSQMYYDEEASVITFTPIYLFF